MRLFLLLLFNYYYINNIICLPFTKLKSFNINDNRLNQLYSSGSKEYHCFNYDNNGIIIYVRGTYGNYGYFEGNVDPINELVFYINWYETSIINNNLAASTGSAILNYSSTWDAVSGTYWITGSGDMANSFKRWNSINGTFIVNDSSTSNSDTLLEKCLYPGVNYETQRSSISILSDLSMTSESDAGSSTFCKVPVGGPGTWLGTYEYKYTIDVDGVTGTETGNYGINPLGFSVKSGRGFVGQWIANTGPFAGHTGTNLYLTISRSSRIIIVGFYCFVDSNLIRTQCQPEYYEVLTDKTTKRYIDLISHCPKYYQTDKSLKDLYTFTSLGYKHKSTCDNEQPSSPWIVASIFIIFSGILIFTFIYIVVSLKNQKNSIILPSEV